jgi:hypothetical protein
LSDLFVAMIVLERPAILRPEALIAELRRQRPDFPGKIEVSGRPEVGGGFLLALGSDLLTVVALDAPLRAGMLDAAIAANALWPEAGRVLCKHRAHVIVASLRKPGDFAGRLAAAAGVTRVCAAIAVLTLSLGVYWMPSEAVHEANTFRAAAAKMSEGDWPIDLWVRLRLFKGKVEGRAVSIGFATIGLAGFVGREIEFEPAFLPPAIVAQWVRGTALYLLAQGPALKHGDTLGVGPMERIRIEHADKSECASLPISRLTPRLRGESDPILTFPPLPPPSRGVEATAFADQNGLI